ncbi:bifunctional riboflavin kinase/FAD synthetase [Bacillus niameyensis]|uniref:bifunctional riboflavin kinase/FAD synthetase n=1 Tax=Bacillus niameyensis TaxID=1522308 RepID=UPI00078550BD|nr:bifunctional riboflavin kinase/FAD synthetase [Bacillus niameyensis]
MKIVRIEHPHHYQKHDFPSLTIALGFFDGVHKGHQEVIKMTKEIALEKNTKSAVMTFDPHPSIVLGKKSNVQYITPLQEKIEQIATLEVDYLMIVHFTESFANLLPEEFVKQYLLLLNVKHVVAGFDYTYGKFGKGTMETLPIHSKGEFGVTIIPKMEIGDEKISSTSIRLSLNQGDIERTNELLGRKFVNRGTVIHGEKRGRTIGFPTANILIEDDYIIPNTGIYVVKMLVKGNWELGACSVGYNPTFNRVGESNLSVEVFLLDFDQSIYDEEVTIEWHKKLRDEQKFDGVDELIAQIKQDEDDTREYFKELNKET